MSSGSSPLSSAQRSHYPLRNQEATPSCSNKKWLSHSSALEQLSAKLAELDSIELELTKIEDQLNRDFPLGPSF